MNNYEIVITIVQFLILIALFWTLHLSNKEYKNRMRPYIGLEDIKFRNVEKEDRIEFDVCVKNAGQIPAKNAKLYGEIIVSGENNGKESTEFECETRGAVFPSSVSMKTWIIGIKEINKSAILCGSKIL
jgi:hypothetical protein